MFPQQEHRALCVEEEKGSAYLMAVQEDPKAACNRAWQACCHLLIVRASRVGSHREYQRLSRFIPIMCISQPQSLALPIESKRERSVIVRPDMH